MIVKVAQSRLVGQKKTVCLCDGRNSDWLVITTDGKTAAGEKRKKELGGWYQTKI